MACTCSGTPAAPGGHSDAVFDLVRRDIQPDDLSDVIRSERGHQQLVGKDRGDRRAPFSCLVETAAPTTSIGGRAERTSSVRAFNSAADLRCRSSSRTTTGTDGRSSVMWSWTRAPLAWASCASSANSRVLPIPWHRSPGCVPQTQRRPGHTLRAVVSSAAVPQRLARRWSVLVAVTAADGHGQQPGIMRKDLCLDRLQFRSGLDSQLVDQRIACSLKCA